MFPNLRAEMARYDVKPVDIAEALGITYDSAINKLNGRTEFSRTEIFKIRDRLFPAMTLEYLFRAKEEIEKERRSSNGEEIIA